MSYPLLYLCAHFDITMDNEQDRYPPLSRRQVALFERNPVCELCFHVCLDLSEEYGGGIHFELLQSLEAADSFCERIILNPWELLEIDQYYHWLERQLDHSKPAVTCAFATISVTLSCMDGLPEPVLKLSHDLRGLIGGGQGGELYDNLRSAARYNDILIHADTYGDIPPQPDLQRELEQFKDAYNQAASEIITLKKQLQMKEQQPIQPSAPVINVAGDYIANQHNEYHTDIHDNHNCPIYACPTKNSSSVSPELNSETDSTSPSQSVSAESILGIPAERDYKAVRIYIEERIRFDDEFRHFYNDATRVDLCQRLTNEFGWDVDPYGLGRNINRKRKKKA